MGKVRNDALSCLSPSSRATINFDDFTFCFTAKTSSCVSQTDGAGLTPQEAIGK